jgi:hypothetical protein
MTPLTIIAAGYGAITIDYEHDFTTGATRYRVDGARLRGVVIVTPRIGRPRYWHDPPIGLQVDTHHLDMVFGDGPPAIATLPLASDYFLNRDDRPIVNGLRLLGALAVNLARVRAAGTTEPVRCADLDARLFRETGGPGVAPVPSTTADRVAAVLAAMARHWSTRTEVDLGRLRTAAAAQVAGPLLATAHHEWAHTERDLAAPTARREVIAADHAALHALLPDAPKDCSEEASAQSCPPPTAVSAPQR